jgi:hypothetical protein
MNRYAPVAGFAMLGVIFMRLKALPGAAYPVPALIRTSASAADCAARHAAPAQSHWCCEDSKSHQLQIGSRCKVASRRRRLYPAYMENADNELSDTDFQLTAIMMEDHDLTQKLSVQIASKKTQSPY